MLWTRHPIKRLQYGLVQWWKRLERYKHRYLEGGAMHL